MEGLRACRTCALAEASNLVGYLEYKRLPQTHTNPFYMYKEHGHLILILTRYFTTTGPMVGHNNIFMTTLNNYINNYDI